MDDHSDDGVCPNHQANEHRRDDSTGVCRESVDHDQRGFRSCRFDRLRPAGRLVGQFDQGIGRRRFQAQRHQYHRQQQQHHSSQLAGIERRGHGEIIQQLRLEHFEFLGEHHRRHDKRHQKCDLGKHGQRDERERGDLHGQSHPGQFLWHRRDRFGDPGLRQRQRRCSPPGRDRKRGRRNHHGQWESHFRQ